MNGANSTAMSPQGSILTALILIRPSNRYETVSCNSSLVAQSSAKINLTGINRPAERKTDDKTQKIGYVTLFSITKSKEVRTREKDNMLFNIGTTKQARLFWEWIDQQVRQLVVALAEKVLQLQMHTQLQAGWNERTEARSGHRNGYYTRWLSSPHGQLRIRVQRLRQGGMDTTLVFERYQRRIEDVTQILRHEYLPGASTRSLEGVRSFVGDELEPILYASSLSRLYLWVESL